MWSVGPVPRIRQAVSWSWRSQGRHLQPTRIGKSRSSVADTCCRANRAVGPGRLSAAPTLRRLRRSVVYFAMCIVLNQALTSIRLNPSIVALDRAQKSVRRAAPGRQRGYPHRRVLTPRFTAEFTLDEGFGVSR